MSESALSMPSRAACDERLRARVLSCGPDALEAAIALMERHDPSSPEQALALVRGDGYLSPSCSETAAEAWDRYFHIRNMPWD